MKKNKLMNLILFICFALSYSCGNDNNNCYGIDSNSERIKIGIPVVEVHWKASYPTESIIIWDSNSDKLDSIAKHISKTIKIKSGKRIFEEDFFYKRINDSTFQQIVIKYSFDNMIDPFSYQNILRSKKEVVMYGVKDEIAEDVILSISKDQAISKLKEWNIELNMPEN